MSQISPDQEYALALLPEQAAVLRDARAIYAGVGDRNFRVLLDHAEVRRRLDGQPGRLQRVEAALAEMARLVQGFPAGDVRAVEPEIGSDGVVVARTTTFYRDQEALELYSRIAMAQVDEIIRHPALGRKATDQVLDQWLILRDAVEVQANAMQAALFPGLHNGAYYGIGSREIGNDARVAWDLQQVLRHRLAWDAAGNPLQRLMPDMIQTIYDAPMGWSGLPFPTFARHPAPEEELVADAERRSIR